MAKTVSCNRCAEDNCFWQKGGRRANGEWTNGWVLMENKTTYRAQAAHVCDPNNMRPEKEVPPVPWYIDTSNTEYFNDNLMTNAEEYLTSTHESPSHDDIEEQESGYE